MTTQYICASCENKIEVFEKDGVTVVYGCQYCHAEEMKLAKMMNEKVEVINTNKRLNAVGSDKCQISLRDFVEGLGQAQKAMLIDSKIQEHNKNVVDLVNKAMGVKP